MIIDFHTHVFPPSFAERRQEIVELDATFAALFSNPGSKLATADELIVAMDQSGVDVAVVMGMGWTNKGIAKEANDYIIESMKRFPSRLVGLCSVNPNWGKDAVVEVERCAKEGVAGIGELHPDTQRLDLSNRDVMASLMEVARQTGLILLTHSSEPVGHLYPGKGITTPEKLYPFARNFPENIIVCAHWGGGLPFYTLMPEVDKALDNVYYDTAASPLLYKPDIFSTIEGLKISDRVLFGTDFPLIAYQRALKLLSEASLNPEAKEHVLGRNAQKLLNL